MLYFGSLSQTGLSDTDSDGYSNAQEFAMASNPSLAEKDSNTNGLPDAWEAANVGKFSAFPPFTVATLTRGQTFSAPIILKNDTAATVNYTLSHTGNTGPAYTYQVGQLNKGYGSGWNDISTSGTLLTEISDADDASQVVSLSGFTFPFYGKNYSEVYVGSNGLLTFNMGCSSSAIQPIPGESAPPALIAPYWANLNPSYSGDVYFKQSADQLTIQFNNVSNTTNLGTDTFQVILSSSGEIRFNYLAMDQYVGYASVIGIQDSAKVLGLQIPPNALFRLTPYSNAQTTVLIKPSSEFRTLSVPSSQSITPRTTVAIAGSLRSLTLPGGVYQTETQISQVGSSLPPKTLTARLTVVDPPTTVALTAPTAGGTMVSGNFLDLAAQATDADGVAKILFYDGDTLLGDDRDSPYTCRAAVRSSGTRAFTAIAIDKYGTRTTSSPIPYTVLADSDGDGIPNVWELANGFDPQVNDSDQDPDHDGYTSLEEYINGTNPRIAGLIVDADNDGMSDRWEIRNGLNPNLNDSALNPDGDLRPDGHPFMNLMEFQADTDPKRTDTDADGMPDGWEVVYLLKPRQNDAIGDPDSDNYTNLEEYQNGTSPRIYDSLPDLDNDGMPDAWEVSNGLNPAVNDSTLDPDADGLTNLQEFRVRTDPKEPDTDGDSLPDGWEYQHQLDPKSPTGNNGKDGDSDHDGVSNFLEWQHGCDPNKTDTDADGTADGSEINQGSDPNNAADGGLPPPPETMLEVPFRVGDPSRSHSETWCLKIIPKGPEDLRQPIKVASKDYGVMAEQTIKPRKNNKYEIVLEHLRTDPEYLAANDGASDYDWEAQIDSKPTIQVLDNLGINTGDNRYSIVKDHWIIDNKDGLLGTVNQNFDASNNATGKKAILMPIEIQEVSFAGSNYHQLKSDDGNTIYSAPHWVDLDLDGKASTNTTSGEKNYPVSFTRNTKPEVGVKFKVAGLEGGQSLKIKADSSQGLQIPETTVSSAADGTITLPPTPASNNLANSIDFFNSGDSTAFKIDWKMSIGPSEWGEVASSKHTVCVTFADPIPTISSRQGTLFTLACKNAKGKPSPADITAGIWSDFTDRDVRRVDGVKLTYYGNYNCEVMTTEQLIKQGDGQCGAWARLLIDLRKVHGIDDIDELVKFAPVAASGFVIKNWEFQGNGKSGHPTFPFLNLPTASPMGANGYNWNPGEVTDAQGIAGQGNLNPASLFINHEVAMFSGRYYDPSYGTEYTSLPIIDDSSIAGFYLVGPYPVDEMTVSRDLNGNGNQTDLAVQTHAVLFRKNLLGLDLVERRDNL